MITNTTYNSSNQSIYSFDLESLQAFLADLKQPKFRAKQILQWIYEKEASSFDEMTNLPLPLREILGRSLSFNTLSIADRQISIDGTRKYVLECSDGSFIETVAMPTYSNQDDTSSKIERLTVCFSTQVGCAMACEFCATGKEGFTRNLTAGEMVEQIITVQNDFNVRVSNIVAMGQGEPFLNYQNVITALHCMNAAWGLGIGARHITVSSCGIFEGIDQFALESEQFTLAISLHCAIQSTRDSIMPRVQNQSLVDLKQHLIDYQKSSGRRITFEYLLIEGKNDTPECLRALISYCKGIQCHINLLAMNSIPGSLYKATKPSLIKQWLIELESAGIESTLRKSRGSDIAGACGQLKNTFLNS